MLFLVGSNILATVVGRFGLGLVKNLCLSLSLSQTRTRVGSIHPWVGLGRPRSVWVELFINYHGSVWVGFGDTVMVWVQRLRGTTTTCKTFHFISRTINRRKKFSPELLHLKQSIYCSLL